MMLADVLFQKGEYKRATHYFEKLLERNPSEYMALAKLTELLRRV